MDKKSKNALFLQGIILASAGIVTKIIGFIYRIPMANMLGEQGNGIYSVAFGIYNVALTLSSYSLPLAVSKMISGRLAKNEYQNAYRVYLQALFFAVAAGLVACTALFFGAGYLEELYNCAGLAKPLRVLAPTTFVVALLGVFRGFFQGHGNMVPTALSQIMEQIINAVVSIAATYQFMKAFQSSDSVAAYGAAGGTTGTLAGAIMALVVLAIIFIRQLGEMRKNKQQDETLAESTAHIYKMLLLTILPVILSQTIYQIGYTIDDLLFGSIMVAKGLTDEMASSLRGVFNTQYNQLINLPVAIASAMAASTIPSIVHSYVRNEIKEVHEKIDAVVKFNMVIAIPAAVGLTVLADPIISTLFPRLVTYHVMAVRLLETGSAAVIFYALSTITTAILQGSNYMRLPVIHSGISLLFHIGIVFVLLQFTELGVYGLVIANVVFPIMVSFLNCRALQKRLQYEWKIGRLFIRPVFSAVIMGIVVLGVYQVIFRMTGNIQIGLLTAVIAAVPVYGFLILRTGCFTREELEALPLGRKLLRFLK
ncbi:MAG: polysaccharide biosynthesis protein [Lachnospiraceae bacterium]|nr:polysaccharide biosynthesis protein [Lachnospiraceae bacterium]